MPDRSRTMCLTTVVEERFRVVRGNVAHWRVIAALGVSVMAFASCESAPADLPIDPGGVGATVVVDTAVRYQTMSGWQANAQAGQSEPGFESYRDAVFDVAVSDGIDRLRLDVRSGIEHTRDGYVERTTGLITESQWRCFRYATVNDNNDPAVLNPAGFHFSELDTTIVKVVLPMKQRWEARGGTLALTVTYVAFTGQTCSGGLYHHSDPEEYAEFALAAMQHLRDRFGLVPDTWELINEPDNSGDAWAPGRLAPALLAIERRLRLAGFNPTYVAPSNANTADAIISANAILGTSAAPLVGRIGYHRYGGATTQNVRTLGDMANARGISTAMTEHIGSGHDDLMEDLTIGMASNWEQFVLAFPTSDNGAQYYVVQGSTVQPGSRTKYLRHFFRHVRRGAVRVKATSRESRVVPVAFRNSGGRQVLVMNVAGGGAISVGGLRAGTYGVSYETASVNDGSAPDITVGSTGRATVQMPSAGVIVLFDRGGS